MSKWSSDWSVSEQISGYTGYNKKLYHKLVVFIYYVGYKNREAGLEARTVCVN